MNNIRKIIYELSKLYVRLPLRLSNRLNFKITTEFMSAVCDEFKQIRGVYTNLTCKPILNSQYTILPMENEKWKSETAIVLQGPIEHKDNFTLETIRTYQKIFPSEEIILSTWNTISEKELKQFEDLGCHIVLSPYPKMSGRGNINYQITSSYAGVKKAKDIGCKYVIKSRTDQRITKSNIVDYMRNLIESFDSNNENQDERLVILQGSTLSLIHI